MAADRKKTGMLRFQGLYDPKGVFLDCTFAVTAWNCPPEGATRSKTQSCCLPQIQAITSCLNTTAWKNSGKGTFTVLCCVVQVVKLEIRLETRCFYPLSPPRKLVWLRSQLWQQPDEHNNPLSGLPWCGFFE